MLPSADAEAESSSVDYIFEPNKEEIVERMLPNALRVQLYKALLDSHAAEHGARMTAMHQATDNGGELLRDLRITYNKARQTAIYHGDPRDRRWFRGPGRLKAVSSFSWHTLWLA